MKKCLVLIVAVLYGFTATAQDIKFGVKAGLNLPTITGDDTGNLSSFATYHVGAVVEIPISDQFTVQPECMFSCQGAEYTESEGYDGKFELAYINVPVMAQFEVSEGINLEAGPQVGFLISAEDVYTSPGDSGTDDIKEEVSGIDFGINFGASYEFTGGLFIGARYNLGLSDINDSSEISGSNQNAVFQFSVGYLFGKGKSSSDE